MLIKRKEAAERQTERDYLGMFDFAKGFMIILILVGHAITTHFNYWVFDGKQNPALGLLILFLIFTIQNIIAPFFMMGGYSFRKRSMKICVKTQIHYFLKPYLYVALSVSILSVIKKLLISGSIIDGLKYHALPFLFGLCPGKKEFLGIYMSDIGPVWFLFTFVLATILLNLIVHEKQMWAQILIIVTLTFGSLAIKDVMLPFCIQQTMICCGYMYVGMLMKKYKFFQKKVPVSFIVIAVTICLIAMLFGEIAVAGNRWKLGIFDVFASYIAGIVYMIIFRKLNRYSNKIFEAIRWMGRHILWFCCIHTVFYLVLPWDDFARMTSSHMFLGIGAEIIIQSVIAIAGCKILDAVVKKSRQRKMHRNNLRVK